jgi:hypothetical protein
MQLSVDFSWPASCFFLTSRSTPGSRSLPGNEKNLEVSDTTKLMHIMKPGCLKKIFFASQN